MKTEQPQGKSAGVLLKETRLKKGLSLGSVHETTKIPMDVLRAIEEGYTIRTLSPFYYRGFLKIYATYLNLDLKDILIEEKRVEVPQYTKMDPEGFDFQQWSSKILTKERKQKIVIVLGIFIAVLMLWKVFAFISHHLPSKSNENKNTVLEIRKNEEKKNIEKSIKPPKKPEAKNIKDEVKSKVPVVEKITKEEKIEKPLKEKVAEAPVAVKEEVKTAEDNPSSVKKVKGVALTVRAKKSSWLRVKADDKVVFQSTLTSGSVESWFADEKIEISGRNINQLEFELNGKLIGSLGREDRMATRIIVTQNGLSVTK